MSFYMYCKFCSRLLQVFLVKGIQGLSYVKPKWFQWQNCNSIFCHEKCFSYIMFISPTVSTIDYKYVVYTNCYKFLRYIFVPNRPVVLMSGTEIPLYTCIYDFMLQCILITCYYFIYVGIEFHAECNILLLYYKHITSQTYFFVVWKRKCWKFINTLEIVHFSLRIALNYVGKVFLILENKM